jgi:hypothetical protein
MLIDFEYAKAVSEGYSQFLIFLIWLAEKSFFTQRCNGKPIYKKACRYRQASNG